VRFWETEHQIQVLHANRSSALQKVIKNGYNDNFIAFGVDLETADYASMSTDNGFAHGNFLLNFNKLLVFIVCRVKLEEFPGGRNADGWIKVHGYGHVDPSEKLADVGCEKNAVGKVSGKLMGDFALVAVVDQGVWDNVVVDDFWIVFVAGSGSCAGVSRYSEAVGGVDNFDTRIGSFELFSQG